METKKGNKASSNVSDFLRFAVSAETHLNARIWHLFSCNDITEALTQIACNELPWYL